MNKVLILTCSTGEGHNSAARAMESAFRKYGVETEIRDPVSFRSERMTRLVSGLYNDTIRKAPRVFGAVYKMGDLYSASKLPSPIYWANSKYAEALKAYILENKFDAVVCTHLYGMEAMMAVKKDPDFTVPAYGVLTDYVTIPFLKEIRLNKIFVSTQEVREKLIAAGTREGSILVTGIPVDLKFTDKPTRQQARAMLGIPENQRVYLVMTGGVGCENMEKLCGRLLEAMDAGDKMIVFTGKNRELMDRLQLKNDPRMEALGFTDQVAVYMAAGDVLLSKPGGLSSTEAAVANIPLVHIHGIPGCETHNARFFSSHGMSCSAGNDGDAVEFARSLARDPQAAETMRAMQRTYVNAHAAEQIAKEVMQPCTSET